LQGANCFKYKLNYFCGYMKQIIKRALARGKKHLRSVGYPAREASKILREHKGGAFERFDIFKRLHDTLPLGKRIEYADRQLDVLKRTLTSLTSAREVTMRGIVSEAEVRARIKYLEGILKRDREELKKSRGGK